MTGKRKSDDSWGMQDSLGESGVAVVVVVVVGGAGWEGHPPRMKVAVWLSDSAQRQQQQGGFGEQITCQAPH